jgi:N-acetylmuramoyl-L-alanine amidase
MTFSWNKFIETAAFYPFEYEWMRNLIVAQSIIESGRGVTPLSSGHCNFNGMKFRSTVASFGGKKFQYFTDSEPFRDEAGNEVAAGTPGAKRWDWFFEFPDYETAIETWCAFWFRKDGDWVPYPKVRAKDPEVMAGMKAFLEYIGPIYCPFFTNSHDTSYADYIITKCLPEARAAVIKAQSELQPPPSVKKSYRGELDPVTMRLRIIQEPGAKVFAIADTDNGVNFKLVAALKTVEDLGGYRTLVKTWDHPSSLPPPVQPKPKPNPGAKRILLDPGHSDLHTGADGTTDAVHEEFLNRLQASIVQPILRDAGFVCDIYDPLSDVLSEIGGRAKDYDMFISFHHNATGHKDYYTCVMVHAELAKAASRLFASRVALRVSAAIGLKVLNFGDGQLPGVYPNSLGVLRAAENSGCPGPCVLVESYFVDAYGDLDFCRERSIKAAKAIATAAAEWYGVQA